MFSNCLLPRFNDVQCSTTFFISYMVSNDLFENDCFSRHSGCFFMESPPECPSNYNLSCAWLSISVWNIVWSVVGIHSRWTINKFGHLESQKDRKPNPYESIKNEMCILNKLNLYWQTSPIWIVFLIHFSHFAVSIMSFNFSRPKIAEKSCPRHPLPKSLQTRRQVIFWVIRTYQ